MISSVFEGVLLAEVRGPSGVVPSEAETMMPHRTRVRFTPPEIGEYAIDLTWNRVPLPNSPIAAIAHDGLASSQNDRSLNSLKSGASSVSSNGSGGDQKVILSGRGLARAICGVEAEFTIDGSRAGPGAPEVTLTGIKSDLNVTLTNMGNNTYRASYLATSPGVYLLNVMWAER